MFIVVAVVGVVQMTIVQIINMALVGDPQVAAMLVVNVIVLGMCCATHVWYSFYV
jgi:hypothetical protein